MKTLFLSPHNDDAVLFGTFTLLAERPHVITVLRSHVQERYGIHYQTREQEDLEAISGVLGCDWEQWPYRDDDPEVWLRVEAGLMLLPADVERVYAPAVEKDGHAHHNELGELARRVFGTTRVRHYLTYTRHGGKSRGVGSACAPYLDKCRFQPRELPDYPGMEGAYCLTHHQFHDDTQPAPPALEVFPHKPEAITLKLRALSCYRSQIETPEAGCAAHFLRDLSEWQVA